MRIVYGQPGGRGWDTVTLLARLAARLFSADLTEVTMTREPPLSARLRAVEPALRKPRGRVAQDICLVIAAQPGHLQVLLDSHQWRRQRRERVLAWVIDSFWTERIPFLAKGRGHIDHLFITDAELTDEWRRATRTTTDWLPFGSDVLAMGSAARARPVDALRVGRQPPEWDSDTEVEADCARAGIIYSGTTPFHSDPQVNQAGLMRAMSQTKFVVAFNNVVAPGVYTHPTRHYLTGRWTDALASGAVVAGVSPRCRATDELLWPGATLEFDSIDRRHGTAALAEALSTWVPERAERNYQQALQRLDWRWRLAELSRTAQIPLPSRLSDELDELRARIAAHE